MTRDEVEELYGAYFRAFGRHPPGDFFSFEIIQDRTLCTWWGKEHDGAHHPSVPPTHQGDAG
jgi:hypothetical protein